MTLRVALVGLARIGTIHLEAGRQAAGVDHVGVFDQDRARATERTLLPVHNRVFIAPVEALAELVANSQFGEVVLVQISASRTSDALRDFGRTAATLRSALRAA